MSNRLRLRRIRLLNFHNFTDETLPVTQNLFLIGDNLSGKTTVLDAIHFALTAGVDMEFNAAARFGPRSESGRNLASVVLRYDLERDVAQRGPSIAYAALEAEDGNGEIHTFGAGAFATALDAQPDVWGFIARRRTLQDIGLSATETDGTGGVRRRVRDRQELEEVVGRGAVLDKGRYRTALAQLLFRDRDAYVRAMELVAAGKAYRELVARARNLDDLFIGLLPPPAEAEFEEVRSALRAIEGIRSDLADLQAELGVLRRVIDKLHEARREMEKIARYEFVGAELERRRTAQALEKASARVREAEDRARVAEEVQARTAALVGSCETALRALRGGEGGAVLEQEEEARRRLAEAGQDLDRAHQELARRQSERGRAVAEARDAEVELEATKDRAARALRSIIEAAGTHLDEAAVLALGGLAEAVSALSAEPPTRLAIETPFAILRSAFRNAADGVQVKAAFQRGQAERRRAEAQDALRRAQAVRQRAELLPDLPGYESLLDALARDVDRSVPLYRLFELVSGIADETGAAIECLLGPRVLGAIVAPAEQHTAARAVVLAHGGGVEVVDPAAFDPGVLRMERSTLPSALADAGPTDLVFLARAYLLGIAGDVQLIERGEPRAGAERAVWTDGYIYDRGAEARVDAGPPRFLGAVARARAAAAEAARLEAEAERLQAVAEAATVEADRYQEVAVTCSRSLEALDACAPGPLLALAVNTRRTRDFVRERGMAEGEVRERVRRAGERHEAARVRHTELARAAAAGGLSELREHIATLEAQLDERRHDHERAREELVGCRKDFEQRTREAEQARRDLDAATATADEKHGLLLPLVDPRYRVDLDDYVFRLMRGHQILPENVAELVREASNNRARAFQYLDSSDGLRSERLWQKYAFRLEEEVQEVRDQGGRPVEQVYDERDAEVRALQVALDERTRDLLERVVMAGLVRRLQGQVRELRETIRGVNALAADLRFGTSRFQFSLRQRPAFQRLLELLREQSILQPALREELRDFFQARLDDLKDVREGEVPEILDYRRWFEYVLQVQSRKDGEAQDLTRSRLRFGSGGEQAVPTYLLVIALASLLYDQTEARLRLLLLDEAFLGIDAGRREVLLQFADRAGVDLIVATPELDGVTPALAASTTLFVEKNADHDVFISDYHWQRPGAQVALFERRPEPGEIDLILGARDGSTPGAGATSGSPPEAASGNVSMQTST